MTYLRSNIAIHFCALIVTKFQDCYQEIISLLQKSLLDK